MNLENLDDKTSIEKDLGSIRVRNSDSLYCKFRYSPQIGARLYLALAPEGRGSVRSCFLGFDDFKRLVDSLRMAATLFQEVSQMEQKREEDAKAVEEAIKRLTE